MPPMPDLTDNSFGHVFTKHSTEIEAYRCSGLVILEAFMDCPPGKLFLALPEPTGFEDVKSVPLKFAVEQRGYALFAAENDQVTRTANVNDQALRQDWAAQPSSVSLINPSGS